MIKNKNTDRFDFFETGFHGDLCLINIIDFIILSDKIDVFIETGTNVGTTVAYVAKKHPDIKCYSCEPNRKAFKRAKKNTKKLGNVNLFNLTSKEFISNVLKNKPEFYEKKVLFWLDAHGIEFEWSLQNEVEFISSNYKKAFIFIDDFEVPDNTCFTYYRHEDFICNFCYIKESIKTNTYQLYYPNYKEKTSAHHPLTGWALLVLGATISSTAIHPFIKIDKNVSGVLEKPFGKMALRSRLDDIKNLIDTNSPVIIDGGAYHGYIIDFYLKNIEFPKFYAFEPNPEAFKIMQEKYGNNKHVKLFLNALGAETKTVKFNVLNNEVSSSILKSTSWNYKYHKKKMDTKKVMDVSLVRLDEIASENKIDLLKLDLQGYELEALKGSEKLLINTKIITTEIEFIPLYENQPLFADIDIFLRERGFRLFNLYDLYTQPDGQLTAGDAVYLNKRFFD